MKWEKGKLTSLLIKAAYAGKKKIRYGNKVVEKDLVKGDNVVKL